MIHGKRVIVVLPAYNAAKTLQQTYSELPREVDGRRLTTEPLGSASAEGAAPQV